MAQISQQLYDLCRRENKPKNRFALTIGEKTHFVLFAQDFVWGPAKDSIKREIDRLAHDVEQAANNSSENSVKIPIYYALGEYYQNYKDHEELTTKCELYYERVIQLGSNDPRFINEVAYANRGIAVNRVFQSRYEEAALLLNKALYLFSLRKDTAGMASSRSLKAVLYSSLQLYEQAINEYRHIFDLVVTHDKNQKRRDRYFFENYQDRIFAFLSWYELSHETEQLDSADYYIEKLSHQYNKAGNENLSSHYFLLGFRHFLGNDYQKAIIYIDSSLATPEYYEEINSGKYIYKGLSLLKLGRKKEAMRFLKDIQSANVEHYLKEIVYTALYKNALAENKLLEAFRFRESAYRYKDSAALITQRAKVFEITQKFSVMEKEVAIKNLEILASKKEQQRNKVIWLFLITSVSLLLLIIVLYTIGRARRIKTLEAEALLEKEKSDKETIIRLQERELQKARNRIIFRLRKRISRDLHDELSSSLAGLRYYVNDLRLKEKDVQSKNILLNVEQEVDSVYKQARQYMHNLNSGIDEAVGKLTPFLVRIRKNLGEKTDIDIRLKYDKVEVETKLNANQQNQLTLLIKEATTNILKHAQATVVEIVISFADNRCFFSISDNGIGFNKENLKSGLGLESMEIRIRRIKGRLQTSSSNQGTKIEGWFPL